MLARGVFDAMVQRVRGSRKRIALAKVSCRVHSVTLD